MSRISSAGIKPLISKTGVKPLKEKAIALWSKCARTRDRKCRRCNIDYRLSAHHIRGSKHSSTLLDLDNALTLCWYCHSMQRFNPELFHDRVIDIIGQPEYNRLREKSNATLKRNIADYTEEIVRLEELLKKLEGDFGKLDSRVIPALKKGESHDKV